MPKPSKKKGTLINAGQMEDLLRAPGTLLDHLSSCARDGLWLTDGEGRFMFADQTLCNRLGRTKEWFARRSCLEMAPAGQEDLVREKLAAAVRGEPAPALGFAHQTPQGMWIWIEVDVSRLRDGERLIGLLGVCRDVTEKKETKLRLRRETEERVKTEEALRSSEEYYRAIFQNTGTAMVVMEEDTTITQVNKESVKFVGYTPEELEGKRKAIDFAAPGDFQMVYDYSRMRLADATKPPRGYEFTIVDRKGVPKDIYMTVELMPEQRKIIASFLDISERKKTESALKESEEKYRNIFENAIEGIFQMSVDGKVLSANPAFARILGYPSPESMSSIKNIYRELHIDKQRKAELDELLRDHGQVQDFEIQCWRPDGAEIRISVNAKAVRNNAGRELFREGIIADVTERKKMQEDLEYKSRKLEETNGALTALLKNREQDNTEFQEKAFRNIEDLVLPYVEKLRPKDAVLVDIIKSNLNNIFSPTPQSTAPNYGNLTARELQIADFIRKGKTTMDICRILGLSKSTVNAHRNSIRRKLDIVKIKMSLRSYLVSQT